MELIGVANFLVPLGVKPDASHGSVDNVFDFGVGSIDLALQCFVSLP